MHSPFNFPKYAIYMFHSGRGFCLVQALITCHTMFTWSQPSTIPWYLLWCEEWGKVQNRTNRGIIIPKIWKCCNLMTFRLIRGCTQIRFHTSLHTLLYNAKSRIYITANKNANHSSPPSSGAVSSHANHLPTSLIACTPHKQKSN